MKYRKIGKTDLEVSEVSLGCWTMGGLNWVNGNPNGWANVDEDEIIAGIKTALDAGVNHFDNADVYGNGKAERMLARALKKLGIQSESVVIATKIGHFPGTAAHAYEPAHIRHQCEQSLINLQREYIDIYYFHHGWFGEHLEEAAATMDALVAEGKVRVKGQSAYSTGDFEKAIPVVKPDALQSWAHALDDQFVRPGAKLQELMDEHGCTFVAFSPLAQGRLLDKFDPTKPPTFEPGDHRLGNSGFGAEAIAALKPKLEKLKARFGETTEDLSAVAQRYILNLNNVACVIPGFRNERQVKCNLAAVDRELTDADMDFIREVLK
ncbi:MAG: aldo/keto reductase [Armatimonadetes bacterium]|nr:aldo/keto reductase [Armatimonadota bacterium]